MQCQSCHARLDHDPRQTEVSDYGTVHHHYRCRNDECDADGGMIITSDGQITQRIGTAVEVAGQAQPTDQTQRVAVGGDAQ